MNEIDIKQQTEEEIKQKIKGCIIRPSVAVIEIGENDLNNIIIKEREDSCNKTGIYFRHYKYEDTTPELTIINKIKELNNDDYVDGIMIQFPIPEKYNEKRLVNTIINSKDINGQTDINVGRLISGRKTITPIHALSIMSYLDEIDLINKKIVILYNNKTNIRSVLNILLNSNLDVTAVNYNSTNLECYIKNSDIIISSTDIKDIIKEDWLKKDMSLIDAGILLDKNKIIGDINYKKISGVCNVLTSENGIKDIEDAMFLKNIIFCYENKK